MERAKKYQEFLAKQEEEPDEIPIEDFAQKYDLKHNNVLLRIYDTTINQMYHNKLMKAIMFGEKLVIDCGYEDNMTDREIKNCAKQITLLFSDNRVHNGKKNFIVSKFKLYIFELIFQIHLIYISVTSIKQEKWQHFCIDYYQQSMTLAFL